MYSSFTHPCVVTVLVDFGLALKSQIKLFRRSQKCIKAKQINYNNYEWSDLILSLVKRYDHFI